MPKSIIGGWRGLSLATQPDIATPAVVNTLLQFAGEPLEPEPETYYVNDTEVTGELLPTDHRLLTKKLTGKHTSKAFPHLVGLFASMAMGKDTATAVDSTSAYKHKIEIYKCVLELPYRTLIEHDGFQQMLYAGVACVGFKLRGERGGFVEFEADLVGSASEAVDATAKPPRVVESYLAYGDVTLTKGGVFDGDKVTGGTSLNAELKSFEFEYKNNGKGVYLMGDPSGQVGQVRRGNKYEVNFAAELELESPAHRADLLAGNEFVLNLPIVGGVADGDARYTVEIILPRVAYKEAKRGVDDGILKLAAKFAVLADPVYGGLILNVINLQQTSYLAAA
ncbi:MAG: phage tail tube protein [bacterium]